MDIEPSIIKYWKKGEWKTVKRVFTTEEQVNEWYRRNRWRADGLSVVLPLKDDKQTTLAPPPKTRTITYIEKDLVTGKIEAVKRYTIPDK